MGLIMDYPVFILPAKVSGKLAYRLQLQICLFKYTSKFALSWTYAVSFFSDFRMLGEKAGSSRDELKCIGAQKNPTDVLLKEWPASGQATVKELMDALAKDGLERNDIIERFLKIGLTRKTVLNEMSYRSLWTLVLKPARWERWLTFKVYCFISRWAELLFDLKYSDYRFMNDTNMKQDTMF